MSPRQFVECIPVLAGLGKKSTTEAIDPAPAESFRRTRTDWRALPPGRSGHVEINDDFGKGTRGSRFPRSEGISQGRFLAILPSRARRIAPPFSKSGELVASKDCSRLIFNPRIGSDAGEPRVAPAHIFLRTLALPHAHDYRSHPPTVAHRARAKAFRRGTAEIQVHLRTRQQVAAIGRPHELDGKVARGVSAGRA